MSEAALRIDPSIDLEEFERRLRAGKGHQGAKMDPLAELARLVGDNDPFVSKRQAREARTPPKPRLAREAPRVAEPAFEDHYEAAPAHAYAPEPIAYRHDAPHGDFDLRPGHYPDEARDEDAREVESPEAWEQFAAAEQDVDAGPIPPAHVIEEAAPKRSARGVMLLVGILAAGSIGFGAALELKSRPAVALAAHAPPVILAGGPTKVAAVNVADAGDDTIAGAALLEKSSAGKPAPAKVVSAVEQPVDLSQQPKAAAPRGLLAMPQPDAIAPAKPDVGEREAALVSPQSITADATGGQKVNENGFPQPKRVKVVSVRPDGSIIDAAGKEADAAVPVADASKDMPPIAQMPAWDAGKATARAMGGQGAASDQASADTQKSLAVADAAPMAGQTDVQQALPPAPKVPAAKPKPARQVADLGTVNDASPPAADDEGGKFSVQLSSSSSERDARQSMGRLKKKYGAEIGAHKLTFHRMKLDDKTVYRVRVSNLTHEAANAICSKVQSSGGTCFVANASKN